jgi:hypothetical protein
MTNTPVATQTPPSTAVMSFLPLLVKERGPLSACYLPLIVR